MAYQTTLRKELEIEIDTTGRYARVSDGTCSYYVEIEALADPRLDATERKLGDEGDENYNAWCGDWPCIRSQHPEFARLEREFPAGVTER
jgi:hypothetical protein